MIKLTKLIPRNENNQVDNLRIIRVWMMGGITGFLTGLFFMLSHNVLTQDNMFEAWEFGLATATERCGPSQTMPNVFTTKLHILQSETETV